MNAAGSLQGGHTTPQGPMEHVHMDNQIHTTQIQIQIFRKGLPGQDSPPQTRSNKLCSQDPFNTHVFQILVEEEKSSKSLGTFVFGKIQCMLDTKTAETRWSSGYSELMFRHILCHHHYWHRPGVIRARMLVTQRQFCMTSSNDAKTDKSAQVRESKFSLMTQWEFCMISGYDTKNNESASN